MKHFNQVRKYGARVLAVGVGAALAVPAFATGPDYSELTGAINFDSIAPIVLGAGAALLTLFVIIKGVKIVIGMVRS